MHTVIQSIIIILFIHVCNHSFIYQFIPKFRSLYLVVGWLELFFFTDDIYFVWTILNLSLH